MTRAQVINDLVTCLKSITLAAGFAIEPKVVLRGIHLVSELNELPALSLMNQQVTAEDLAAGVSQRRLLLHLWGAVRAPRGDYGQLDQLAAAVVSALAAAEHNPHWDRTHLGPMEIFEGGAGDPLGLFDLQLEVSYQARRDVL